MTFFAGNSRTLLVKKQTDKDSAVSDFSDAMALRIYEFTADPARVINELAETDASTQQGASHVSALSPGLSFGVYGRPSELDLIAEALMGNNADSATVAPATHTATPDNTQPYYSILEVVPYGGGRLWDGCRLFGAQFTSQDDSDTELRVTGLQWVALGVTNNVTAPDPMPAPADELPFIHAEAAIKYATVHLGLTKQVTVTVNRNGGRRQGDSGFRAVDATPGKFAVDGSVSRYTQDNAMQRAIDAGSKTGTATTADIYTEAFSVLYTRGSAGTLRSFLITGTEISYATREEALDLDGNPYVEVLGFRTEPQATLAANLSMVTVNAKATPDD
jgi:hypothetical protein